MTVIDHELSLLEQCEAIWAATEARDAAEKRLAQVPDLYRLWDGDWNLQHIVAVDLESSFDLVDGDTGPGRMEVPTDTYVGQWLIDMQARIDRGEKRNVHLTIDIAAGDERLGYRMSRAVQRDLEDGTSVVVSEWASDHEELKYYQIRSNPFTPAAIQLPRVFLLPGPLRWLSGTTLFLQLFREHNPLITFPDDPGDVSQWLGSLDQSNWSIVVKPLSFVDDMAAGTIWGIVDSRWDNYHDRMKPMWQDGEITPILRRYLAGDPDPWPGANLRPGTLIVDFVDNSGVFSGTSHGGSMFDGIVRTVAEFAEDFVDSNLALWEGATVPAEYYIPGKASQRTRKQLPTCVYLARPNSGLVQGEFAEVPGTAIQITTGGHSMPGVNEVMFASIAAAGDIIGNLLQVGSLGGPAVELLRPLLEDTILAWMEVKLFLRAQKQGWSRYFEHFEDSAGKAYTISSVMVLRAGAWATRAYTATKLIIRDARPFTVGIHMWIGDRAGATRKHDWSGRIFIDRISKLTRSRSRTAWQSWGITLGDERALRDPFAAVVARIERLIAGVQTLGVF